MEHVEHVTLTQLIMVEIVSVTLDSLEIEINVKNAIQLVENVMVQMPINALFALMLAIP